MKTTDYKSIISELEQRYTELQNEQDDIRFAISAIMNLNSFPPKNKKMTHAERGRLGGLTKAKNKKKKRGRPRKKV